MKAQDLFSKLIGAMPLMTTLESSEVPKKAISYGKVMPKKKYNQRQVRMKMQKASRKINRRAS